MGVSSSSKEKLEDYEAFVEKFKPKLTTDDCFTPPAVYDAVLEWVRDKYDLGDAPIIRPFRPDGDYQSEEYPEGCVVVDNPPFSILASIRRWYTERGIKYFLFAPSLTIFMRDMIDCAVCTFANIEYANGAKVRTSFVTNLDTVNAAITTPELKDIIEEACKQENKQQPKLNYPKCVLMATRLGRLSSKGEEIEIPKADTYFIRQLESQKPLRKAMYGAGFLLSSDMTRRLARAEARAEARVEEYTFDLSERELAIIRELDGKTKQSERGEELNA